VNINDFADVKMAMEKITLNKSVAKILHEMSVVDENGSLTVDGYAIIRIALLLTPTREITSAYSA
jgi:hypothetical protein